MLEIERFIGNGREAAFFRLRQDHSLGVKILFKGFFRKNSLLSELKKARVLKEAGVSVVDYVDVVEVKIPMHIEETFKESSKELAAWSGKIYHSQMKRFFIRNKGKTVFGLVMEYIPDDIIMIRLQKKATLVSKDRIEYIYNKEIEKIDELGITIEEGESYADCNIIWSESRAKLYFIDFDGWNVSNIRSKEKVEKIRQLKEIKRKEQLAKIANQPKSEENKKGLLSWLFGK